MKRIRFLSLLILLTDFCVQANAQSTDTDFYHKKSDLSNDSDFRFKRSPRLADTAFYRDEFRLLVIQPGIGYLHSFNHLLGFQAAASYTYLALNRVYPLGPDNYLFPSPSSGSGLTTTLAFSIRMSGNCDFLLGAGYRYFNAPPSWRGVDYTNGDLTAAYVSETGNALLTYMGLDIHNRDKTKNTVAFNMRMGMSSSNYTIQVSNESYNGQNFPNSSIRMPPPPFTLSGFNNYFYMNVGFSVGLRFHPQKIPGYDHTRATHLLDSTYSEKWNNAKEAEIADSLSARHTFFAEAFGTTASASINYEYRFKRKSKEYLTDISLRTGFGMTSGSFGINYHTAYKIPAILAFSNNRKKNTHLETGIGFTFAFAENGIGFNRCQLALSGTCMYKYQAKHKGLVVRAGWTPNLYLVTPVKSNQILLVGMSVGYTI